MVLRRAAVSIGVAILLLVALSLLPGGKTGNLAFALVGVVATAFACHELLTWLRTRSAEADSAFLGSERAEHLLVGLFCLPFGLLALGMAASDGTRWGDPVTWGGLAVMAATWAVVSPLLVVSGYRRLHGAT